MVLEEEAPRQLLSNVRREDPAGARAARGAPELGGDGLHLGGVVADDEAGERIHGPERWCEGAAEERQVHAHEARILRSGRGSVVEAAAARAGLHSSGASGQ